MAKLRIFLHCFWGAIRFKSCRLCEEKLKNKTRWFCACGYANRGITYNEYILRWSLRIERDNER